MRTRILIATLALVSFLIVCWTITQNKISVTGAAPVPPDFEDVVVTNIAGPTALAFTPDGRLLIATQGGQLRVYQNGNLLGAPALDLSGRLCANGERGLLGVAVDPNFAANNFIYLYYTFNKFGTCPLGDPANTNNPVNRVARFILPGNNVVNPGSEIILIDNIHSPNSNHNGGDLHFGKDGFLYISVGDGGADYAGDSGGGGANDAARDRHVLLGKILRITRDGLIPPTNPFQGANSGRCNVSGATTAGNWCQETFASGLRNPFRIAFDPNAAGTRFFINDVGQNVWEEIDEGISGADYGWNIREGRCVNGSTTNCGPPPAGLTNPIFDYQHTGNCNTSGVVGNSITGGAFVPSGVWPLQYEGAYLFGEFVCGKIFQLSPNGSGGFTASEFATGLGIGSAVTLTFGPFQNTQALYYTTFAGGGQVRRIRFIGNTPPQPVIIAPAVDRLFRVHEDVILTGAATDAQDGALPDSSLRWEVLYHFGGQIFRYFISEPGNNIPLCTPPPLDLAGTGAGFLEIRLIATDSQGLSATVSQILQPRRVNITFATNPAGLRLNVNEVTLTGPQTLISWDNFQLNVNAPNQADGSGQQRNFVSWSDGGAQSHTIITPATATTYTANFTGAGAGIGLTGSYYDNIDFTSLRTVRNDATVNFDWGTTTPAGTDLTGPDTFSARWSGRVQAVVTGAHTFTTTSDDGVRLFVNGQLIINNFTDHAATDNSGTINLTAGVLYDIRMEYFENGGLAVAKLAWSYPGQARQIIPTARLFPHALLVVGNTTLNNGDAAVKQRLEGLGYAVTVRAAPASAAADANEKGLVVLSSTSLSSDIGTKFRATLAPVLTWENALMDDLGMTGNAAADHGATAGQMQLQIINASHPLAAGLSGTVTVTGAASIFSWGRPNANAANIATIVGDANKSVIFGYGKGAAMVGLTAPERRVGLFLENATAAALTGQGGALFDAAVRWVTNR